MRAMLAAHERTRRLVRRPAARLVGRPRPQEPAVAAGTYALSGLDRGDHAAADPGEAHGRAVLRALRRPLSRRPRAGGRRPRRGIAPVERPRLLRPGPQPAPRRRLASLRASTAVCFRTPSTRRRRSRGLAARRPLPSSRRATAGARPSWTPTSSACWPGATVSVVRSRRAAAARRAVAPGGRPHARAAGGGLHPGRHGPRRDGVRAAPAALRRYDCPVSARLPGTRCGRSRALPGAERRAARRRGRAQPLLRGGRSAGRLPRRAAAAARHLGRPVVAAAARRRRARGELPGSGRHRAGPRRGRCAPRTCSATASRISTSTSSRSTCASSHGRRRCARRPRAGSTRTDTGSGSRRWPGRLGGRQRRPARADGAGGSCGSPEPEQAPPEAAGAHPDGDVHDADEQAQLPPRPDCRHCPIRTGSAPPPFRSASATRTGC